MPEKEDIPAGSPEGTRFSFTVPDGARGLRLDRAIRDALDGGTVSRETLKKAISDGLCLVEGSVVTQPSRKVLPGQSVTITLPPAEGSLRAEQGDLDVLYEDESIVVCNKPAGLTVHPCPSCPGGTLIQRLASRYPSLLAMEGQRPGIVHRIDKDTSGLLVAAKNDFAHLALSAQLADHTMARTYEAVVCGNLREDAGTVDAPIGRHPTDRKRMAVTSKNARRAVTHWSVIARYNGYTHIRCELETGRTHQIRVHMAHIGHPLVGDFLYGTEDKARITRPALHSYFLELRHPMTGEMLRVVSELPEDMKKLLEEKMRGEDQHL